MKVKTQTDRAKTARRMVAELLLTDQPAIEVAHDPDSELWKIVKRQGVAAGRFPKREAATVPAPDRSHVAMAVNLDACIQCNLCVRACREVQVNDVIGMAGRGHHREDRVRFRRPDEHRPASPMANASKACPTGALMPSTMHRRRSASSKGEGRPYRRQHVCPYCGVGCQLTYQIKDDKIVAARRARTDPGQPEPAVRQGRFGFDYVHNPQRLLKPMVRRDGVPKVPHEFIDPSNPWDSFPRGATWEEALDRAAGASW